VQQLGWRGRGVVVVVEWGREVRPPPDSKVQKGGKLDTLKFFIFIAQQILSY
jgi:hypothetical protein